MEAPRHDSPQRLLADLAAEYERSRRFLQQLEGSLTKRTSSFSSRATGAEKCPPKGPNDHFPGAESGSPPQTVAISPEPTAKPESAPSKLKEKLRSLFTRRAFARVNEDVPRLSNSQVRIGPPLVRASTGRRSSLSYYTPCEASAPADPTARDITSRHSIDVPPSATALGDRASTARRTSVVHYGSGLLQQGRGLAPGDDPVGAASSPFERPATGRRPSVVYFGGGLLESGQGADLRVAPGPPSGPAPGIMAPGVVPGPAPEAPGVGKVDALPPPASGRRSSVLVFGSCVFDLTTEMEAAAAAAEVAAEDLLLSRRTASLVMSRQGGVPLTPSNRLRSAHSVRRASIDVVSQSHPFAHLQQQVVAAFLSGRQQTMPTLTANPPPALIAGTPTGSSSINNDIPSATAITATNTVNTTTTATTATTATATATATGTPNANPTTAHTTTAIATTTNNSANITTATTTAHTTNATTTPTNATDKDPPPPPPTTPPPQPQFHPQQPQYITERRPLIRPNSVRPYPSGSSPSISISSSALFAPTVTPAPVQPPRLHPLQIAAAAAAPPGTSPISSPGALTNSPCAGTPGAASDQGPMPPGNAPWHRGSLAANVRRLSSRSMAHAVAVYVGIEQPAAAAATAMTGGAASGQWAGTAAESSQGRWCGGGLSSGNGSVEAPSPRGASASGMMRSRGQLQPQPPQPPSAPQSAFHRVRSMGNGGGGGAGSAADVGGSSRVRRASVVSSVNPRNAALEVVHAN